MKTFLKTLLALTLVAAFLLTGCDTTDVSSGSSSNINDVSSEASSDTSALASSVVSEDSSYEDSLDTSSVPDTSAETSSVEDSSSTASEHTDVTAVPDEIWQKIIDSQFTKDPPSFDGYDTWEEFIKEGKEYIDNYGNYYPDDLSGEKVLIRRYVDFYTRDYLNMALTDVKKSNSLLSMRSETSSYADIQFTIFNEDCTKGARFYVYSNKSPYGYLVYFDDSHYRFATNYWPYSYRWSWYQFTLNDARRESLANSDLDLSKTTVAQLEMSGLGYGFVFSDGEHEYFMRTNDFDIYEYPYIPIVVTEYERLYSFDEVISLLENYPHFDENGHCIYETRGLPSYRWS